MFPRGYFTGSYFAPDYFPPVVGETPPIVIPGGGRRHFLLPETPEPQVEHPDDEFLMLFME